MNELVQPKQLNRRCHIKRKKRTLHDAKRSYHRPRPYAPRCATRFDPPRYLEND